MIANRTICLSDMDEEFSLTIVLDEQRNNAQNWTSLHQCLLMLFDSPLNHAGYLEVFIRLIDGRVIKLHREVRIPRTFKRFDQLFCNFLQGCSMPMVQTKDGQTRLLQFVGKSIEKQLENNCSKCRIRNLAPRMRTADHFSEMKKAVLFIEFGPVDFNNLECEVKTDNNDDIYSISRYPLSPALTCVKLTTSFETILGV